MAKLAIRGGPRIREEPFPAYNAIGAEEEAAALRVLRSGRLSTFIGSWHVDFLGGKEVRALEEEWARAFGVKHAVSVNSATSGLFCSVGAAQISPGDEVIVSPYTMSASAVAAVVYGGIPVFADVEPEHFCLDPASVEAAITSKTRAIIVVDLFGLPYDADRINAIARKHGIVVIEDAAQAPGAMHGKRAAGTLADMGVYSLNFHKHIHTGEGGLVVTDDDALAERVRLIRNHAEAVLSAKPGGAKRDELINMIGFNYRMTEIGCAIAREQLKKLPALLDIREKNVDYLGKKLAEIPCIKPAKSRPSCRHAFYVHALLFDEQAAGVDRKRFFDAVKAELPRTLMREDSDVLLSTGYVRPLYMQPMYQQRIAIGRDGWPFTLTKRTYEKGMCPVTERLHERELATHEMFRPPMTPKDLDAVADAFAKVWENRAEL
jgi:dTDP-4-amino-4,6-dideoxygalactose transaminase